VGREPKSSGRHARGAGQRRWPTPGPSSRGSHDAGHPSGSTGRYSALRDRATPGNEHGNPALVVPIGLAEASEKVSFLGPGCHHDPGRPHEVEQQAVRGEVSARPDEHQQANVERVAHPPVRSPQDERRRTVVSTIPDVHGTVKTFRQTRAIRARNLARIMPLCWRKKSSESPASQPSIEGSGQPGSSIVSDPSGNARNMTRDPVPATAAAAIKQRVNRLDPVIVLRALQSEWNLT